MSRTGKQVKHKRRTEQGHLYRTSEGEADTYRETYAAQG